MSTQNPEPTYNETYEPPPVPSTESERTWAMLCHLAGFAGYVFPFGNIVGPLLIWLIKKDEMPLVDDQGKESLNFQITIWIYVAICIPLMFIVIGIFLAIAVAIFQVIVMVIAAIKANQGIRYRYPLTIRFIS